MPDAAPSLADETALLQRARVDPAAFGALYEAHYPAILNYLYRRTLSIPLAEELTSNTFFSALRGLASFQSRPSIRFRSWLYRIATNELRMHWRRRHARPATQSLPEEEDLPRITFAWPAAESPEQVWEQHLQFARLHEALAQLPEPYQSALTLRFFQGLPHEEIAQVLGKRVGTVKSLVHRGLAKLAHRLPDATP